MTSPVSAIEAIEKAMRDHIKVDATGLSPAVASAYVFGFDEAAKAIAEIIARQAEALQRENAEKDVQIERLEADLEEARDVPWPDWANTILKTLQHYGYDPVVDGEVDLGDAFKDYLEGVSRAEQEDSNRTALMREALRPFARLADEISIDMSSYPDGRPIWGLNSAELTYGDFRRARALLGGENAE